MLKAIFAVVEPNVIQAYSEFPTAPAIEEFGGFEDWHYGGNTYVIEALKSNPDLASPTRKRRASMLAPIPPAKKAPLTPLADSGDFARSHPFPTLSGEEREESVKGRRGNTLEMWREKRATQREIEKRKRERRIERGEKREKEREADAKREKKEREAEAKREKKEEHDKWKNRMKYIEEMLRRENENIRKELEQERAKGNRK